MIPLLRGLISMNKAATESVKSKAATKLGQVALNGTFFKVFLPPRLSRRISNTANFWSPEKHQMKHQIVHSVASKRLKKTTRRTAWKLHKSILKFYLSTEKNTRHVIHCGWVCLRRGTLLPIILFPTLGRHIFRI